MKMSFRDLLGIIIMFASIVFSFWLAIGVMLVGGIVQVVEGIQIGNGAMIGWGVARAILFELGFIPAWIGMIIGVFVSD